ncbi:MAG TPA: DUF1533 domain-containing protein [Candidatus Sulfotelmatobacter sp.]|jgi:hypothetical protein|nr:DUF1533 domain-containing protein [Candidatus Sulfotelmatobacter sp.]
MKITKTAIAVAMLAASLSAAEAQTTLTSWTFDNNAIGVNASPTPFTGLGTASAIGLGSSSNPDVLSLSGSSTPSLPYSWRVQGTGGNIGWSTAAAIGSQGAQFSGSTVGYYQVQVSFDVYATADAEENLLVQYTTEGTIWHNATITSVGTGGTIQNNSNSTNSLVVGSYLTLASGWNNQVVVNLSGISGVDNCSAFAIRLVNAGTGTNCLTTTGSVYNNTSGYWVFDNVTIQGISFDTIANWTFDNDSSLSTPVNNPPPAIANNTATAAMIGFNLPSYVFADGSVGSTNFGDITKNGAPYSSTGPAGQYVWRLRGQNPGNGWTTAQPIGTQGAEFDVSTVNYTNIILTFDLYQTSQGEAKMCVLYTTNGWVTTNIANQISYGANPTLIVSNTLANPLDLPGTYFFNSYGSTFFNDLVVDFTGDHTVENNPNFAIRIVNAATGNECVNYLGQPYNNASGNSRLDNIAFNGQFEGSIAPTVTNSTVATVDGPFTNTFASNPTWAASITAIYFNGVAVTNSAYTISSTSILFNPANSAALQTAGLDSVVIYATGFTSAKYNQVVATGKATKLTLTQPAAPSASGGTLTVQPMEALTDQYANGTTNPYAAMYVVASVSNSVAWTLGGDTNQPIVNGNCVFSNLTATVAGSAQVKGAAIQFTIYNYTNTSTHTTTFTNFSSTFTIGAPPVQFTLGNLAVIQIDTIAANSTFSIVEVKPSVAGQTAPVNIVPVTATGSNALRFATSGSMGKLALSDDGTFLVFNAFKDGNSATPDETFNLNRAVGIISNNLAFNSPISYVSTSFGGSQPRSACSPDNVHFLINDKGGLYVNSTLVYQQNDISVRSFAGTAYALTAKVAYPPTPSFYPFVNGGENFSLAANVIDWSDPGDNGPEVGPTTPPPDAVAQDFYMVATNLVYIADQNGGNGLTNGVINKWMLQSDNITWINIGSWTNADNCENLFATTNGAGGVYLFYVNVAGTKGANSIVRLTDSSIYGSLNLISTNIIYTSPSGTQVAGLTFVPQLVPYTNELTPPPIFSTQLASTNGGYPTFAIGLTPDDGYWRSNITAVTVNGTLVPSTAYTTNQAGMITFNPSALPALEAVSTNLIVISAAGYTTNSITQVIAGAPAKLVISTQGKAPPTNGYAMATQPVVTVTDTNGNPISTTANITATPVQSTWTLGGTTVVAASSATGVATFSGLTASNTTPGTPIVGATIAYTSPGLLGITNSAFTILGVPPIIIAAGSATVDSPFNVGLWNGIAFADNPFWRGAITNVTVNGSLLGFNTGYSTNTADEVVFTPSASVFLQTNIGADTVSIIASNYNADTFSQTIGVGAAARLGLISQPLAPLADGGVLTRQPIVVIYDQYNNVTTSSATVTAKPGQSNWTLGGSTNVAAITGTNIYAGLNAFSTNSTGTGTVVTIVFSSGSLAPATSSSFIIPKPVVSKLKQTKLVGGNLMFSFTNATGLSFSVLATNDVTAPAATWPVIGQAVESPAGSGNYQFTNSAPATNAQLYELISQP